MYALRVEDERGEIRRVVVEKDAYAIGRSDDNDLVLTDINVSRHHVRLEVRPIGVVLVDAGSTYGVRMNGVHAPNEVLLQGGDVFAIGDYRFELVPGEGAADISPTSTIRMTKVREDQVQETAASVESKAVPGMEGEPGVHYTVAMSEDESLKILLDMRRNMMAGSIAGSSGDSVDDEDDDQAFSGEARRGRLVRTIMIVLLLVATIVLAVMLYSLFQSTDTRIGMDGLQSADQPVAARSFFDLLPRS